MRRTLVAALLVALGAGATAYAGPSVLLSPQEQLTAARTHLQKEVRPNIRSEGIPTTRTGPATCAGGKAAGFSCSGVDLLSFVPLEEFADNEVLTTTGAATSDLWGWTDPETQDEYVLLGKTNGTAFFRVTDPRKPVYLGALVNSSPLALIWHDIKVYADHAFIVSESAAHGMRVFDLTRLRDVTAPQDWVEDVNYPLPFSAHNIAINEDTGFAYVVGGGTGLVGPDACLSGLHMVDIRNPKLPLLAGCQSEGGGGGGAVPSSYVHDTQCVVYRGPDAEHRGKEVCLNSAETHLQVVDVTDKSAPVEIGRAEYPDVAYAHQGWLTDDQATFLMGDELDEGDTADRTRTLIFDVSDLDQPVYRTAHRGATPAIDHNMYVRDGLVYQSNYSAGLRVLDTAQAGKGRLAEVAFFDSFPQHDAPEFVGTWSNYPYFASGTIAVSGIDDGLFLLKVQQPVLKKHARAVKR